MPPLAAQLTAEYRYSPPSPWVHYCTSALNRTADFFWETRYNVTTTGYAPSPHPDAHHYGTLAYYTYFLIYDRLDLKPSDVVVDLGCGKGRPVITAATYPIKKAIGVEIDPPLCAQAAANGQQMRGRHAPIEFVCQSATDYNYDDVTVIVMFHPFGPDTMREVIGLWKKSLERRPRELRIVYGNPWLSSLLAGQPWLKLYESWEPGPWSRVKFPVHFYRTV